MDGRVVRVDETVRRPSGPWTPTIQALLAHLQTKAFPAPRPLGLDEQGREVVSFLPGRASNWPWPAALLSEDGARQVGRVLRAYHAAVRDFAPPPEAVWAHGPQPLAAGEIVIHGDFGPHNLIWQDEALTGVIDFELARPGASIEDATFAALRVANLRPDAMARAAGFETPPDRRARLRAFADGFGVAPAALLAAAPKAQADELERITRLGARGVEPWSGLLRNGLAAQVRLEMAWLDTNMASLAD